MNVCYMRVYSGLWQERRKEERNHESISVVIVRSGEFDRQ